MKKILLVIILLLNTSAFANNPYQPRENKNETVICVHGFLGAPWNMFFLEKNLKKHGWSIINWKYSSRDKTIKQHGHDLALQVKKVHSINPNKKISFVAHSLGSLVLRAAVNDPDFPKEVKATKIVLIGPPNKGTIWARKLNFFSLFRRFAKNHSGRELATKKSFDYLGEFPKTCKVLVIAGNFTLNPWIKKENDGIVAVDETCLNTKHKHITIKRGHKSLLFSKKTFSLTLNFLSSDTSLQ